MYLLAAAFYALLAFLVLYGLLLRTGTHIAGFDYFNYNWNFWWTRYALSNGLNIYLNNYVMAPHNVSFAYHALTAFWYPLWAVLEPLVGTLNAMNGIIFVGSFLNGFVLFVFLRRQGVSVGLALLGGAMLQISPVTRYFYYNTHINLMDWFWLPAHMLLWGQIVAAVERKAWRSAASWAVLHGLAIWGLGHTDLQFPIFTAFLLVPYALWTLLRIKGFKAKAQLVGFGLLAVLVGGGLLWVAGPLPYIARFQGALAPGTADDRPGIPLRGYLSVDPVWWNWNTPTLGGNVAIVMIAALATWVIYRGKKAGGSRTAPTNVVQAPGWFWLVMAIPPLLLSMGPDILIGDAKIPMPFRLLHAVTNGMFRMPWRLAPIYVIAGVIFAGLILTPILRGKKWTKFALPLALLSIAADVRLYQTPPATDTFRPEALTQIEPPLPSYDFYKQIGTESGEAYDNLVLLEVPTGAATGEVILGDPRATQMQFYGMEHHKRTLNGFISRAPIDFFWPINTDDPLLSWLGQRRFLEPDLVRPELEKIINDWPVGYVVVHQDMIGRNSVTPQEIIGYLNQQGDLVCPWIVERDAVVYRTSAHPDGCEARTPAPDADGAYTIDVGASGDEKYIGWGWHWQEPVGAINWRWAGEYPQADLYVDLPQSAYEVTITMQAFAEPRTVTILLNDQPLGEAVTVQPDTLQNFTFQVPAELVNGEQENKLTIRYDAVIVPAEIGQSADPRKLSVAVDTVRFVPG